MNDPHKFVYAPPTPPARSGSSPFAIASICVSILVMLFVIVGDFLERSYDIDLFRYDGNLKRAGIATMASIVGILLAIRASQDRKRKTSLARTALWLNLLVLLFAWFLFPTLRR